MKVRLIIDSTTNIPEKIRSRFTIIPLKVRFGDEEFIEGITIDDKRFYEKLIESDVLPTTSQPSPEDFAKAYKEALEAGEEVLVITLSSKLSGTYQSAVIAAMDFPDDKIHIVDSKSVAIGTGILVQMALSMADKGMSASQIAEVITKERENIRLIALLDTLEYLKKGGRISKTVAFAGGILSIKPVICVVDGEVKLLGKARGSKHGNNLLVQEIKAAGGVDFQKPVLLGYTGLTDALLQKYISDSASLWENNTDALDFAIVGSVVGTHVGPGAVAAAFFSKDSSSSF